MARNIVAGIADSRTFRSLQHRNYRLLWSGTLISQSGDWMDQVAFNWLVLEMTGSPFYLGLVNLCRAIPMILFTVLGGVAADRLERRKLMMTTQAFAMVLALILAVLVSTGLAQLWQVFAIAMLRGVMMSFNIPARQTLISDLVPRRHLTNAIALNAMVGNLTRVIGPSLGGILIGLVGVAGCFYINGFSFLGVLWTLHTMEIPPSGRKQDDSSVLQSLKAGFRYIWGQRTMLLLVVFALTPMFLAMPYQTLLAVFAHDELDIGPAGLGILMSASAIGAIGGTLIIASLPHSAPRGKIMIGAMILFGALLMLFSYSTWVPLSIVVLLGVGVMQTTYSASNNSILQSHVDDEFRGRVMSTLFLQRGLVPLGTALAGTVTMLVGVRLTLASMAAVVVLLGITAMAMSPSLRRLR